MFSDLATMFLNHLQLHVHYDGRTELLNNFEQDRATHISDHNQEWHRRKRIIEAYILDELLLEWFVKSLQEDISKDMSLSTVFTEEYAIFRHQKLEFI